MVTVVRAAFLAVLLGLALFSAQRIDLGSNITNFMPDARAADLALLARSMAEGDLARTMFLTVGTRSGEPDDHLVAEAVTAMADRLRAHPEVAWLRIAPEDRDLEEVWKVYFPRRFGLVSLDPEREIPAMVSEAALERSAAQARDALASPAAALVKRSLPADPLGWFARILERMREQSPSLQVRRGVFFADDGYGVLLLATKHSPFDGGHQGPLLEEIHRSFAAVNAEAGAKAGEGLVLEASGINRFAIAAESAMIGDMPWIGGASLALVSAIFLGFFRSLPRFLVAMLPTLAGLLVPAALGSLVFGKLDGLTLAFGASLIGTTIDYPTHLLNHFAMLGGSRRALVRHLAPSISLGALTTMASFAGLGLTAFPGFRQIAFFAVTGVGAALATTLFVVPFFVAETSGPTRVAGRAAGVLGAVVASLRGHRRVLALVPVLALVLGAVVLPHLRWEDDLSKLGSVDPTLEAEETKVRGRVSPLEMGRAVMVQADSEQDALLRTEEIARRLEVLREQGAISGYRSAADLVWSEDLQRRNQEVLRADEGLGGRVAGAFARAGFREEAFEPFVRDLSSPAPPPLQIADLEGTGLDTMLAPMIIDFEGQFATVSYVRQPRDEAAVRESMGQVPGARYFVQRDFVNDLYAEFRTANLRQVFVGSALVILVLALRYRRWRPVVASFLPAALVPVVVLSGLTLAGVEINLLHIVSIVMVMGMGTDFGVFLVDSRDDPRRLEATLVSLLLCCLTTVSTFAVLAISAQPALRAIGVTTGLSVGLAFVLAPVSLLLVDPAVTWRRPGGGRPAFPRRSSRAAP